MDQENLNNNQQNIIENQQNNILVIDSLSKSFEKNKVLDKVNFTLKKGSVMGLMGENGAGKSTLMKCLFGIYQKDEGRITFDNVQVNFTGPKDSLENGIAMVHQELNQCLDRNVMDNIFLGRYPTNLGIVNERAMYDVCIALFSKLGLHIDPNQKIRQLSVSQRQMVEIAKAVSYNAKVIVLDEPTSSLTEREVSKLFSIIRTLRDEGISFVFISHKMDELFQICDEMTVLRDGKTIFTKPIKDLTMGEVISAMVGRSLDKRFPEIDNVPGDTILKVENLSTFYEPYLKDISFEVRKGEIFGFYGLVGAGRSELLESLFGLRVLSSGSITYSGKKVSFKSSSAAMKFNFALITEERKKDGIFKNGDLTFNTCISNLSKYKIGGFISQEMMRSATEKQIKNMNTKCMGPDDFITALSGGNQQKVIIGKWLEREPDVFLMDEPTRGIDVGAKYEIYQLILNMAKQGKTIIVVSSEMPEILGITNRIAVMSNHRLAGIVNTKETNQEELLTLSAKYL